MKLLLSAPSSTLFNASVQITGSKSESNRCLLLQALYPNIVIENRSNSDDAEAMQKGLMVEEGVVDIHHAGTAMRFLTAYFAAQVGSEIILTGSKRMTERPIKVLVEALQKLGADISYQNEVGYPPILIKGRLLEVSEVSLPADISSQYISALLLIAPSLVHGISLRLVGKITSVPYINMTLGLLNEIGVESSFEGNQITVRPKATIQNTTLVVESDWSSASYFYSIVALSDVGTEITLSAYKPNSLQGDSVLSEIYRDFGVQTVFGENNILLKKTAAPKLNHLDIELGNAPDIAQTIAVSCFGLGMGCHLTGLHTLKIKETDRLEALYNELTKLGASISVTDRALTLLPTEGMNDGVAIDTYNDHRMAMAFAPLALKTSLKINEAEVVSKSYPDFWQDLKKLGFQVEAL